MILYPNAKINLGLNIINKRPDGYHNLESLFYPVPLRDKLEIAVSEEFSFSETGIKLDSKPDDNLVLKAYNILKAKYSLSPVNIHLHKSIPFGGGLGGGSSDASFCLSGLNELFKLHLNEQQLADLSVLIGADCPFFIYNKPALVSGIGDIIKPVEFSLKDYFLVLVKPAVGIPTPLAYKNVKPSMPELSISDIIQLPVSEWKQVLKNDFENSVFKSFPELIRLKEILYANGALYASMSGSGSTFYGIFEQEADLRNCFNNMFYFNGWL
ncbi:4-(cytidine 5'-diphospho)-2-C-methyl-D-erythritol kinase [Saccharicrinis sp. FJH54]|uniref:4-(cytidine 5'-diphospho)-2-C-methyl-D-erythritol kinase n=1 Tax=Saccharicrinis sp. FJH54 TaxID=3344665 RepID=UPI0035D41542